jgi:hypothetical protein
MSGPDKVRRRHCVLNVYSSEEASAARASRRCRLNPDFSIAFLNDFDVDNQRTNTWSTAPTDRPTDPALMSGVGETRAGPTCRRLSRRWATGHQRGYKVAADAWSKAAPMLMADGTLSTTPDHSLAVAQNARPTGEERPRNRRSGVRADRTYAGRIGDLEQLTHIGGPTAVRARDRGQSTIIKRRWCEPPRTPHFGLTPKTTLTQMSASAVTLTVKRSSRLARERRRPPPLPDRRDGRPGRIMPASG